MNAEIGVSRSAGTSHVTGTRLPSRARRSNSAGPGAIKVSCTIASLRLPARRPETDPRGAGPLEEGTRTVPVVERGLELRQLRTKRGERLRDRRAIEPADLRPQFHRARCDPRGAEKGRPRRDRKSTRLNSSHVSTS